MAGVNRRSLVTLGLCGTAATVAAASWLRKPPSFPVATPVVEPAGVVEPRRLDAIVPTAPPKPLPAISFLDGEGGRHELSELLGRPVLLNLWATWCQPCIAELPSLAALARSQGPGGIAVVALSTDRGGTLAVREFLAAHRIDLPVRTDPQGASVEALGARGLPTTLLIDRQGRERARLEGAADWASEAARAAILGLTA